MIELKGYQTRVLASLKEFLRNCVQEGRPDDAFQAVLRKNGATNPVPYKFIETEGGRKRVRSRIAIEKQNDDVVAITDIIDATL